MIESIFLTSTDKNGIYLQNLCRHNILTVFHTRKQPHVSLYTHLYTSSYIFSLFISFLPFSLGKSIKMAAITSHCGFLICLPELLTRCWLLVGCLRRLSLRGVILIGHQDESLIFLQVFERRKSKGVELRAVGVSSKRAGCESFYSFSSFSLNNFTSEDQTL